MTRRIVLRRLTIDALDSAATLLAAEYYRGDDAAAREHLADHATGQGDTFLALDGPRLAGFVTIRWVSRHEDFRRAGIPLIHALEVLPRYRRRGVATRLMDAAEQLIATRADTAGITVGLFDAYGPAQRLYARRGYVPDGQGACRGHTPLGRGEVVALDHDIILWLTKRLR